MPYILIGDIIGKIRVLNSFSLKQVDQPVDGVPHSHLLI